MVDEETMAAVVPPPGRLGAHGQMAPRTSVVQRPNVRPGAEDNLVMVTTRGAGARGTINVRIRLLRSSNASGGPPPRVVLDTDTYNEIDDQFALVHVLLSPERVRLGAIYAAPFHNSRSSGPADGMRKSFEEIHRVLEVVGHVGPPVLEGATEWLTHSKSVSASPATRESHKSTPSPMKRGPCMWWRSVPPRTSLALSCSPPRLSSPRGSDLARRQFVVLADRHGSSISSRTLKLLRPCSTAGWRWCTCRASTWPIT